MGIYITLIETAAKIMNFKCKYGHTSAMVVPVSYTDYEECSFTCPYIKSELAWYVPSGKHVPLWQSIFKVFN